MLAAPAGFAIAFELVRAGTDGPAVDAPHFSTYGIMAFVLGRGFHALLSLLPLMLGAAFGAGISRRGEQAREGAGWGRHARRGVTALTAVVLLALAVGLLRPARTAPIVDRAGEPVPGAIAELTGVETGGHRLTVMIRGQRKDNPVLLFLAGGPGGSEIGAMRRHLADLERHFVVATWDQRGSGKSYPQLDPTSTITPEGYVADTLAVTEYLQDRFGQDRVVLVGQSWGSLLGVLAIQRAPERYRAFVGVGQMVSIRETDRIFYEDTLAWARKEHDSGLATSLEKIGPPPYRSILDYETALSHEHDVYPYDHSPNAEGAGGFSENLLVEEYSLLEQVHVLAAFMETFNALYPKLQGIDLRRSATRLEVPVFFAKGAHEARGRVEPFEEWFNDLSAPHKEVATFDTSGHRPMFEQPGEFVDYMVDTVLARTR